MYVFLCRECSDLGVGGGVSTNPNIVRICKSVRIIGRSLISGVAVLVGVGVLEVDRVSELVLDQFSPNLAKLTSTYTC